MVFNSVYKLVSFIIVFRYSSLLVVSAFSHQCVTSLLFLLSLFPYSLSMSPFGWWILYIVSSSLAFLFFFFFFISFTLQLIVPKCIWKLDWLILQLLWFYFWLLTWISVSFLISWCPLFSVFVLFIDAIYLHFIQSLCAGMIFLFHVLVFRSWCQVLNFVSELTLFSWV